MMLPHVLMLILVALAAGREPSADPEPGAAPAYGAGTAATVHGTITVKESGPRRVANRYGGGSTSAQAQQPIATVVFLRGRGLAPPKQAGPGPQMAQRDTTFTPNLLFVPVGSTVDFPNRDPFFHNVFSYSKTKRFDLGRFPNPESKPVTFDEPGVVNVFCEIHKSMRAVIVVVENSHYAEVDGDGSYEIPNVPAGSYELVVWHADKGMKTLNVQVPASGSVRVDATL